MNTGSSKNLKDSDVPPAVCLCFNSWQQAPKRYFSHRSAVVGGEGAPHASKDARNVHGSIETGLTFLRALVPPQSIFENSSLTEQQKDVLTSFVQKNGQIVQREAGLE